MVNAGEMSDGYHTFNELYDHRIALFIALCRQLGDEVWRSRLHSDGTGFEGWFVLGINSDPGSQITYHLPDNKWDECKFAATLDRAPQFDGHTSADVVSRLGRLT